MAGRHETRTPPRGDCQVLQERVEQAQMAWEGEETLLQYEVEEGVILAGQPEVGDWPRLAAQGISLVVNVRGDAARARVQAGNAARHGLRSLHLPLPVYELELPHLERFREVVAAARASDEIVLIHCRTGSRTALLWMLYRITFAGLSRAEAEAELRAAGYDEDDMEVFTFCADDYFERVVETVS